MAGSGNFDKKKESGREINERPALVLPVALGVNPSAVGRLVLSARFYILCCILKFLNLVSSYASNPTYKLIRLFKDKLKSHNTVSTTSYNHFCPNTLEFNNQMITFSVWTLFPINEASLRKRDLLKLLESD